MLLPLDGPSLQAKKTVTDSVVQVAAAGVSALDERKVVTFQPLTGDIYVYFGDGSTPSAGTVSAGGFVIYEGAKETYEASERQGIFVLAVSGSVDYIVAERG